MVEILLFYPEQKALRLNSNEISIMARNYLFKTVSQPTRNPRKQPEQPSYHDLTQDKSSYIRPHRPLKPNPPAALQPPQKLLAPSFGGSLKSSPLSSNCAIARPGYSFSIALTTPVHVYGSAHPKTRSPSRPSSTSAATCSAAASRTSTNHCGCNY